MADSASTWVGGLLGLHALTALHPGSGAALGTVDLPVQRERHTHWPTIAGSALKGILRDTCREQLRGSGSREDADNHETVKQLFGPPTGVSSEHAGALSVTDARLIAYPVRSLKGVFAWVSCPAVIDRLVRDAKLVHDGPPSVPTSSIAPFKAITSETCPCLVDGRHLLLEEFKLEKVDGDPTPLARWLAERLLPNGSHYLQTRDRFERHFIVLHDDDFTHFVRFATEITARIGLNYDTKTVKDGALFYQEFLPTESLFYSVVLINAARSRQEAKPTELLPKFADTLRQSPVLQIGGDETTGKGYCSARLFVREGVR